MLAVLINVAAVLLGASLGLLFGSRIRESFTKGIMTAIALCTFVIGIQSAVQTSSIMIVMVCLVIGTVIGVALHLDDRMNGASDRIRERLKGTKLFSVPVVHKPDGNLIHGNTEIIDRIFCFLKHIISTFKVCDRIETASVIKNRCKRQRG